MTIKAKFLIILMLLGLFLGSYTSILIWNTYRNIEQIKIADLDFKILLAAAETRTNIDMQLKEVASYLKFRNPKYRDKSEIFKANAISNLAKWQHLKERTIELGKIGEEDHLLKIQATEKLYYRMLEATTMSFHLAEQGNNEGAFLNMKEADKWEKELFNRIDSAMMEEKAGLAISYKLMLGRLPSMPWLAEKSSRMIESAELPIQFFLSIEKTRSSINRQLKDFIDFLLAAEEQEMSDFKENGVIAKLALNEWISGVQVRLKDGHDKKEEDLQLARSVKSSYKQLLEMLMASFDSKLNDNSLEIPDIMENQINPLLENMLFPKLDEAILGCQDSMVATHDKLIKFSYNAGIQLTMLMVMILIIVVALAISLFRNSSRSYQKIKAGMRIIGNGKLDHRINLKTNDELGQFAESFDKMTQMLQEATRLEQEQERIVMSRERLAHVGKIAAGAIHTIQNPLHGVINCTEILRSKIPSDDKNANDVISMMQEGLERIERVTCRLLALTREAPLQKVTSDINVLIMESIQFIKIDAEKKGILLEMELEPNLPWVPLDPDRLPEAFINLLSNAIDACRNGDVVRFKSYHCHNPWNGIGIIIQDSGEGIPEETMPKILDPFFTTKPVGKGSGLGLPISRRIIEEHDGILHLSSDQELGTIVEIFIPETTPKRASDG